MQEIAVEKEDAASTHFDRNSFLLLIVWKVIGHDVAVVIRVIVRVLGIKDTGTMGAGNDPEAAVLYGGVIDGNPGAGERAVAGGNVVFVLMSGWAGLASRLDELHRLPGLYVGTDHVR